VARRVRNDRSGDRVALRRRDRVLADDRRGGLLAAADARRSDDANVRSEQRRQLGEQLVRAGHLARQAVADADGERRWRDLAFLDDVEVVVEGRDLEHLGLRELHLGGERSEVLCAQVAEAVLQLVQVLDQEVARPRRVAEERDDVGERIGVDAPAARRLALALARRSLGDDRDDGTIHGFSACQRSTIVQSRPAPRAHWYLAPSTATGISVEYA
jgi:hypothetical protein